MDLFFIFENFLKFSKCLHILAGNVAGYSAELDRYCKISENF